MCSVLDAWLSTLESDLQSTVEFQPVLGNEEGSRDREEDLKWSMGECCRVATMSLDVPGCPWMSLDVPL
jgi:hypothetical protein